MGRLKKKDNFEQIRKIIEKNDARIHFVGIGGVSMYSLARLALLSSNKISGSDAMLIGVSGNEDRIILVAVYDNLGKGASGAAVECMNTVLGADKTCNLDI